MAKVEIYTQPYCGYCDRAKRLLDRKGVAYTEIDLGAEPLRRREMVDRAEGRRSTPQIFIADKPIGGSDDIAALEASGELDTLLTAVGATA